MAWPASSPGKSPSVTPQNGVDCCRLPNNAVDCSLAAVRVLADINAMANFCASLPTSAYSGASSFQLAPVWLAHLSTLIWPLYHCQINSRFVFQSSGCGSPILHVQCMCACTACTSDAFEESSSHDWTPPYSTVIAHTWVPRLI